MALDKTVLKKFNLLYVEDDKVIRTELSQLLLNFFNNVFTARDGFEGLATFKKNKIDIILTDINMPNLNGIEMIREIRNLDHKVPVIFSTAHSDNEYLAQAIKLKVQEYVVKPIDIRELINTMNEIVLDLNKNILLEQQRKELEKYKEIMDATSIIIKTDTKMKITYVNEHFCRLSGFSKDELIGKDFKYTKHQDTSDDLFTKLYADVLSNKSWRGNLKNRKKDSGSFTTDCYMMATLDDTGEISGSICVQKDITQDLNKKREVLNALMRDKSDMFIKSKEGSLEQTLQINELKTKLEQTQSNLDKALKNIDKYIFSMEKLKLENKNLKTELSLFKKKEGNNSAFKLTKENSDLRLEIKNYKDKIEQIYDSNSKEITNLKFQYEMTINELKDKVEELQEQLDSIQSDEVLKEKMEFWKEKAKTEALKLEALEKQIISFADAELLNKIFK